MMNKNTIRPVVVEVVQPYTATLWASIRAWLYFYNEEGKECGHPIPFNSVEAAERFGKERADRHNSKLAVA
jgi:hypothetical protein